MKQNGEDGAVIGAILAGGKNTRFGGKPKGLELVGGTRVIDRVATALRMVASELVVVSNDPSAGHWVPRARVCRDSRSERGSLVGIHAALTCANEPVCVVAWDMPFVSWELLALIRYRAKSATHAVIPDSGDRLEGCCAWYAPAALPTIEAMLSEGEFRLEELAHRLPSFERIGPDEISAVGDPAQLFLNVNSPAELARAESLAAATTTR